MPQVDLDMDALALLRLEARKDGDDLSACIRRLVRGANAKKSSKRMKIEDIRITDRLTPESLVAIYPTAILRFMCVLGWLHRKHGADFAMVEHCTGRGRTYFAKNPQVILDTGSSTAPKRIPESDYWVCTNLSNKIKCQILDGAMTILGYTAKERRPWINAVEGDDDGNTTSDSSAETDSDEDDDGEIRI